MVITGIKKYKTKDGTEKIKAFLANVSPDGGYEPCGNAGMCYPRVPLRPDNHSQEPEMV